MGIMDLFTSKQAAAPQSTGPEGDAAGAQGDAQGNAQGNTPPAPEGLDRFGELFKPSEGDYKPQAFDAAQIFNMTPEATQQLQQQLGQMNFMDGAATPEMIQAIQAGGDDALKALPELINNVAKNAFKASLQASMQINQASLAKAAPAMENRVQDLLRERTFTQAVKDSNPVFDSPAAKPILDALVPALQAKYPNANAEEIKKLAGDYITDLAKSGVPAPTDSSKSGNIETNWDNWYTGTPA